MTKTTCFVAYPSKPPELAETIEEFISKIIAGKTVQAHGWKSTNIGGKFIITAICSAIDDNDIFICDLTHLNRNVLFELGYAIAKNKRIWIIRDKNINDANENFRKFGLLATIGFIPYSNSYDLIGSFYREKPDSDLSETIFKDCLISIITTDQFPSLLYLKSSINTEASLKLTNLVNKSTIRTIIDDPDEVRSQTLQWYIQEVNNSYAVIGHLLKEDHEGSKIHNAKISFVAGLAHGFGRNLLLLAHEPYESPIDYKDLLKSHNTAIECEEKASDWLHDKEDNYYKLKVADIRYTEEQRAFSALQQVRIGSYIAEHESDLILDYFIENYAYLDILKGQTSILIGRKGTGKTAILYKLANDMEIDKRNHVCVIKPIAYELEGVVHMLGQTLEQAEKGYLIESFWKFLIYTELAKSVVESLSHRPSYYQTSEEELVLKKYVDNNHSLIMPEFSIRMDTIVDRLKDICPIDKPIDQRLRISELLHENIISKLRIILGNILSSKNRVSILIDNLDKAWRRGGDLQLLSELLMGLLAVSERIVNEFKKDSNRKKSVNVTLTVFLRSDIFSKIIGYARERDKINYMRILWNEEELLLRVIEERIIKTPEAPSHPKLIWERYFCAEVNGKSIKRFILDSVLPRPRDIIYFIREALTQATNCKHSKIEENDLIYGRKRYSQYALDTIITESEFNIEELLYEFVGANEIITKEEISRLVGSNSNISMDSLLDHLCDLTFLGREVEEDRFIFQYNDEEKHKYQKMARRLTEVTGSEKFKINWAFQDYLEIKKNRC